MVPSQFNRRKRGLLITSSDAQLVHVICATVPEAQRMLAEELMKNIFFVEIDLWNTSFSRTTTMHSVGELFLTSLISSNGTVGNQTNTW